MYGNDIALSFALRQTIVSPDVAIRFDGLRDMPLRIFMDILNSATGEKFRSHEIEAFLIWCTYQDDLYKYDIQKEQPLTAPWDLSCGLKCPLQDL